MFNIFKSKKPNERNAVLYVIEQINNINDYNGIDEPEFLNLFDSELRLYIINNNVRLNWDKVRNEILAINNPNVPINLLAYLKSNVEHFKESVMSQDFNRPICAAMMHEYSKANKEVAFIEDHEEQPRDVIIKDNNRYTEDYTNDTNNLKTYTEQEMAKISHCANIFGFESINEYILFCEKFDIDAVSPKINKVKVLAEIKGTHINEPLTYLKICKEAGVLQDYLLPRSKKLDSDEKTI